MNHCTTAFEMILRLPRAALAIQIVFACLYKSLSRTTLGKPLSINANAELSINSTQLVNILSLGNSYTWW